MKNTVGDAFFFFLLREHERRMKKDLKALRRVEKREFSISKRLYKEDQLSGKIKPYDPPKEAPIPPNPVELEALNKCMTYLQQQAQNNPQNGFSAKSMEISPVLLSGDAGNSQSAT